MMSVIKVKLRNVSDRMLSLNLYLLISWRSSNEFPYLNKFRFKLLNNLLIFDGKYRVSFRPHFLFSICTCSFQFQFAPAVSSFNLHLQFPVSICTCSFQFQLHLPHLYSIHHIAIRLNRRKMRLFNRDGLLDFFQKSASRFI
ncbi:hypothetical protein MsAc7_10030 [Methanolapillus millepedarum]|uniref:Uncharacterized protein n=1 Tax=Methanolapillus millepedarum TaxID=3028296 RepID=A0AA96V498_9EURY|nr:hypothetical protein MsAc7_10030 [Methanosarcinaceae archaeon Ac7]